MNMKKNTYKNLLIRAVPGLHEKVLDIINNSNFKKPRILDLGAGQGALSLRLHDSGYDVKAVDFNIHDFKLKNKIDFIQVDFDDKSQVDDFILKNLNAFDIIIGIEVIEHIHNPWEYIGMMSKMLKKNGIVIVSTPNISSWHSRLRFLVDGMYDEFNNNSQKGHINPTSKWKMRLIFDYFDLRDIKFFGAGRIYQNPNLFQRLFEIGSFLLRPFQKGILSSYCIIGIAKKIN